METTEKYVPMPPKVVGREFVRQFYTLMNKAPEYLYRFYGEDAKFIYDDLNPVERRTVQAVGKWEIRDIMSERIPNFKHTSTKVHTFDTIDTLDQGLLVQVYGEISFNEQPMRTFSQSVILIPTSPFRYYVQNDIFRFCDYESDGSENQGSVTGPATPPMQPDWGTQCEEEDIEPYDGQTAQQAEPRAYSVHHVGVDDDGPENEVKLDTSDSGLSSDAEKVIMDIQSHNLKSILQEQRAITKETVKNRGATPPIHTENEAAAAETDAKPVDEANRTQLFRDSCILTVGNVINPNVEFSDDTKRDEIASLENERAQESVDTFNASKSDDNNSSSGKLKYRKRKDKKSKARQEMMSKEKSLVESVDANQLPVESKPVTEETIAVPVAAAAADVVVKKEIATPEHTVEKSTPIEHKPSEPTPTSQTAVPPSPPQPEQETPKSIPEMKTYADLAKAGTAEWIDELAQRRGSTDRNRTRPTLVRRSSRTEKTTPSQDPSYSNRSSPKNDQLQVFIGNIPHSASEDDIRKMFSRFGRLLRVRLHSNTRREWLPRYAFITYENVQSVKNCLMKKATFYWPENAPDGQKLNVNGDPSVDIWEDADGSVHQRPIEPRSRNRELKQFGRNFSVDGNSRESNKPSPDSDTNTSDAVKSDRRKAATRT